jgi:hypothetical protein
MIAVVNRNSEFGTINGVVQKNLFIMAKICKYLKEGKATKLVDTEETLAYKFVNLSNEELKKLTPPVPKEKKVQPITKIELDHWADLYTDGAGHCYSDADPGL